MPTWACAAALACLKHSARAALVLSIFGAACCADSDVARNGSKATANSVRILMLSIFMGRFLRLGLLNGLDSSRKELLALCNFGTQFVFEDAAPNCGGGVCCGSIASFDPPPTTSGLPDKQTFRAATPTGCKRFEPRIFGCYRFAARLYVAEHVSAKRQLNPRSPTC
jgi:hypothetical protein